MPLFLDLILLLIAGITIILAYKRGFVRLVISAASTLIALLLVFLFSASLAGALAKTSLAQTIQTSVESGLDSLLQQEGASSSLELATQPGSVLYQALDQIGIDGAEFTAWLSDKTGLSADTFHASLTEYLSAPVVNLILQALASVLLFVGANLVLRIAGLALSGVISHLPLIGSANRTLGLILGIVLALIRVCLFATVVCALFDAAAIADLPLFHGSHPDQTLLVRFFDLRNLIPTLFG